jgi:hypothetical protein
MTLEELPGRGTCGVNLTQRLSGTMWHLSTDKLKFQLALTTEKKNRTNLS